MIIVKILSDIETAMKARETEKLTALRTLHAEIKNVYINTRKPIDNDMCIDVLSKLVKQKNESYDIYVKANKLDRAEVEKKDANLYQSYLPEPIGEDEVKNIVANIISSIGANSIKDMGKVMAQLTPQIKGKFDVKLAGQLVKSALT